MALASAWSSMTPPLATLMMRAPFLILLKASSLNMPYSITALWSTEWSIPQLQSVICDHPLDTCIAACTLLTCIVARCLLHVLGQSLGAALNSTHGACCHTVVTIWTESCLGVCLHPSHTAHLHTCIALGESSVQMKTGTRRAQVDTFTLCLAQAWVANCTQQQAKSWHNVTVLPLCLL